MKVEVVVVVYKYINWLTWNVLLVEKGGQGQGEGGQVYGDGGYFEQETER